jgi:hypothetical protein
MQPIHGWADGEVEQGGPADYGTFRWQNPADFRADSPGVAHRRGRTDRLDGPVDEKEASPDFPYIEY